MKKTRLWLRRLHLYIALISALPLLFMCFTGTLLVYREAIEDFAASSYTKVEAVGETKTVDEMMAALKSERPQYELAGVLFPKDKNKAYSFWIKDAPLWTVLYIDPYTLKFQGERAWEDWKLANIVWWLTDLHFSFKWGRVGNYVVGFFSILLLLSTLSGIYLWWPKGSKFSRYKFELKLAKRWKQTAYNLHAVVGIYAAIALIIITITGTAITFWEPMQALVHKATLSPPPHVAPVLAETEGVPYKSTEELLSIARNYLQTNYQVNPTPEAMHLPEAKNVVVEFSLQGNPGLAWADHYHVYVHAQTGEVVDTLVPQNFNRGQTTVHWIGALHYGTWGAIWGNAAEQVSRILWLLASLAPIFLIITGFSVLKKSFWKR